MARCSEPRRRERTGTLARQPNSNDIPVTFTGAIGAVCSYPLRLIIAVWGFWADAGVAFCV